MKNVAASVRARLANLSRAQGVELDFLIERFAMGRLHMKRSSQNFPYFFFLFSQEKPKPKAGIPSSVGQTKNHHEFRHNRSRSRILH